MRLARAAIAQRVEVARRSARLERACARAPRYLFLGAVAITCVLGLRSILAPPQPATAEGEASVVDNAAQDFAQRFARAYLTYDSARPSLRERLLGPLVPEDFDTETDATPSHGAQKVEWTQIASNQEAIAGGRVIVVAAGITTEREPVYLSVPVARAGGAIGLTAYPSLVGPPISSRASLPERVEVEERDVVVVARRALANYLAGQPQNLDADLARDAVVSMPSQPLEVRSIEDVTWAAGEGSTAVLVTATAADRRRALWTLTYEIGIARESGRVVVTFIETVPTDP